MSWDYRFGGLIFLSTLIDYVLAIYIAKTTEHKKKKLFLFGSIFLNLVCILGFFKYYNFFSENLNWLFTFFGLKVLLPELKIVLPVGISFFTFQSMSYTIDVYRGKIPVEKSFLKFALYVSFFPQLVAGPIVVAKDFLPQLYKEVYLENVPFRVAIRYFTMGYFKKVIISDNIAPIVDIIFHNPENYGTFASWFGATLFIIQIYCDFSGYSDMAYGSALLLGYELPENFRMPFLGNNFTELWRRWHISLSSWLREYVYFSLGGSRLGEWRHKFNLFFTMLLAGLWHGANWTFVIWGGIQGIILAVESSFHKYQERKGKFFPNWMNIFFPFLTFFGFVFIGTMFRAESLEKEWIMLQNMFSLSNGALRPYMLRTGIFAILVVGIGHISGYFLYEKGRQISLPFWLEFCCLALLILIMSLFTNENVTPFIYFQF